MLNIHTVTGNNSVVSSKSTYLPNLPRLESNVKLRLFCFPFGGAGASFYRDWNRNTPHFIEVCPVQLPGREERLSEKPFTNLVPMVSELGKILVPYFVQPFAFFGHSMGALISFELTRYLRRYHQSMPECLFISARPAPQIELADPPTYDLPDQEFIENIRKIQGTPETVLENDELMELFLPILRDDFRLCQTYRYSHEQPLNCPFHVFGGLEDSEISQDDLLHWRSQTIYPMQLKMFKGNHFYIIQNQASLLQIISQQLNQIVEEMK
jgi:medium-chain acyl-[acyl-carrier-protein] hydrolase